MSWKQFSLLSMGSNPIHAEGALAQLVERIFCKDNVRSSNLLCSRGYVETGSQVCFRSNCFLTCGFKSHYPYTIMSTHWSLDLSKRKIFKKLEIPINILKLIGNNKILKLNIRNNYGQILKNYTNNNTKTRKFCIFTGRTKGNITKYKINRTQFKQFINEGKIAGIKNASW